MILLTKFIASNHLFQNTLMPRVANFAVIIETATMFIKKKLKTRTKLKELKIMY